MTQTALLRDPRHIPVVLLSSGSQKFHGSQRKNVLPLTADGRSNAPAVPTMTNHTCKGVKLVTWPYRPAERL